ncbi:MAG: hypothetical protein HQL73_01590 [Magnetococcales bacterium]|nr:hypothetical protein [Magnetococcales bacterium]
MDKNRALMVESKRQTPAGHVRRVTISVLATPRGRNREFSMANDDLLKLYGSLVEDLFGADAKGGLEDCAKISAAPSPRSEPYSRQTGQAPPIAVEAYDRLERNKSELRKVLPTLLSPNDLNRINSIIVGYRKSLDPTEATDANSLDRSMTERHLKAFRDQLALGQENSLEHNPFHQLTRLLFQSSLNGLFAFFARESTTRIAKLPPAIRYSPTLKEIWRRPKEFGGFFSKVFATVSKWVILTRPPLAILLFLGSSYTTYRGVNDLLQSQELIFLVQDIFQGAAGESRRYLVSMLVGFALSSAILDFKTRLFAAIADSGGVFTGIRDAFFFKPRWMILALILTGLSIKTNYDGIVSIFSKKEDLAVQATTIKKGIHEALGNRYFPSTRNPNSLFDLKAVLDENIATLVPMLESIPNDEAEGLASSGDARKGPRYWAKHFIIFGGYEPGISDVGLSHNTSFAQSIDIMLANYGIDFFSSVRQKINLLGATYTRQIEQTETNVVRRLNALDGMMNVKGYSLEEIKRLLAIEHYQINAMVGDIILDFEHTKEIYQQVVEDLHELTKSYLTILLKVDLSGNIQPGDYVITASMNVPRLESIERLRAGMIPEARHKSFAELRFFLVDRYGTVIGGLFLATILFLSISMDLADPLLFSRSVARHGRRDLESVNVLLDEMAQWEKQFTQISNDLLDSVHARAVLGDRAPVTRNEVEMRFHQQVDRLDAEVKHPADRNPVEGFILWFFSMFLLNRPNWTRAYNVRLAALHRFVHPGRNTLRQWFATFFLEPGRMPGSHGPVLTETCIHLRNNSNRTKEQINRIVKAYSRQLDAESTELVDTGLDRASSAALRRFRFPILWFREHLGLVSRTIAIIFFRSVRPQPEWFPISYYQWRRDFVHSLARSSNLKNLIARLQPELQSLLDITIPSIFENSYYPTVEILKKYGHHLTHSWNERFSAFETKLMDFEQSLLESLGMIPALAGTGSQADFLETLNSMESRMNLNTAQILEVLKVIDDNRDRHSDHHVVTGLALEEESQKLLEEAHSLIAKVKEAEEQKKRLEEERLRREMEAMASTMDQRLMELRQIFNDISQTVLRMKMRELQYRKRGFPSQAVMLNHHLNRSILDQAPKEADAIIHVMETILQSDRPYTQRNLDTLDQLKTQAMEIQDRLIAFQDFKGILGPKENKPVRESSQDSPDPDITETNPLLGRQVSKGTGPTALRRPSENKVK